MTTTTTTVTTMMMMMKIKMKNYFLMSQRVGSDEISKWISCRGVFCMLFRTTSQKVVSHEPV